MKKLYAALLVSVAASASTAFAAEEQIVFDLTTQSAFSQCSQTSLRYDHSSYTMWTFSAYSGLSLSNYNITAYDDYLTTPDLALEAGKMYVVYTKPTLYSSLDSKVELDVLLGQGDDLESYDVLRRIESTASSYGSDAELFEVSFMVPEDGDYRVSFECFNRLYLKETKIVCRGESAVPCAPADFSVVPDPDGALTLELSFTVPSATLTGQPLSALRYNLYRGVQKIRNGVEAAPGERIVLGEKRGEAGNVTYAVEILAGDEVSEKLSVVTYVGPETPQAPEDVRLAVSGGMCSLSWKAPVAGVHGAGLDPSRLSYNVTRILDGVASSAASGLSDCSFSEEIVPDGMQTLQYAVSAVYAAPALESASESSASVRIGSLELPFADSFAGAELSALWDNQCVTSRTSMQYFWKAAEKVARPEILPYDGDGGLALYNFYNIMAGNSGRLATPPLSFKPGDKPMLTFAKFNIASNNKKDLVKVQVSCDNGEWVDVPDAVFTPQGEPAGEWVVCSVALADAIPAGTKAFSVGFLAESDYGQDFAIDDVRVFNQVERDLEVSALSLVESVKVGNSIKLGVRVVNNGSTPVLAGDYSLLIDSEFPAELDFGVLQDLAPMASAVYELVIPVNALHAYAADSYSFAVSVEYAGDEVQANNSTDVAVLALEHSAGQSAADLEAVRQDDGSVLYTWTAAKDLGYEPVNLVESFEDESYADGSTGPFNGWTIIDLDGKAGGTWYSATGSVFNLAKNASTPTQKDGKNVLAVTVAGKATQDDWIISPRLNCRAGVEMSLSMLLGLKQVSSYGNTYNVEILYTTSGEYSMLNPQDDFTNSVGKKSFSSVSDREVPQDNKMHEVSFEGIPAEATYVAIRFSSKGNYDIAMWVDNLRIQEADTNPLLGYRLYDLSAGAAVNDELIPADATSYLAPAADASAYSLGHPMFLCAVYPDGEAEPSNQVDLDKVTTGVESLDAAASNAGPARYYDLRGIEVGADALVPGIYIRREGARASKLIVR